MKRLLIVLFILFFTSKIFAIDHTLNIMGAAYVQSHTYLIARYQANASPAQSLAFSWAMTIVASTFAQTLLYHDFNEENFGYNMIGMGMPSLLFFSTDFGLFE